MIQQLRRPLSTKAMVEGANGDTHQETPRQILHNSMVEVVEIVEAL
jgi:hypothetical protein